MDDTPAAEDEPTASDPEPEAPPPETIPHLHLETARAVMVGFVETRPDAYVARLEVSPSEWLTITDDSLPNELERELLTSAAAMCLWQEWMIWYQGEQDQRLHRCHWQDGDGIRLRKIRSVDHRV